MMAKNIYNDGKNENFSSLMRQFNYNFAFIFILLAFQIAFGQVKNETKNTDLRIENLKNQSDQMLEALNKSDFEKFVEMMHPKAVEQTGGKEEIITIMKQTFEENPKIFKSLSMSIENPTEIIISEGKLFGIVPLKIEGTTHTNRKIITNDCFVGISEDNGKNWAFVSGEGFDELFPSSKGKLKIIVRKTSIDGVEQ